MRDIYLADLDKTRPVLVLTRVTVADVMRRVSVAPITSTMKGLSTEVTVGPANGLDGNCVVSCDNIRTIDRRRLGRHIGFLFDHQEEDLARAIVNAFDLRAEDL